MNRIPEDASGAILVSPAPDRLTPAEIVSQLDRYIVGQERAKRAVAIAIRNRWRRSRLPPQMRREVFPKNILMIGPTGVGKTEIARRVSQIVSAPFAKVEASRFTEVGYVGRDVEGMVRDLVRVAVAQVQAEEAARVRERARELAEQRIIEALLPTHGETSEPSHERRKARLLAKLRAGELDAQEVKLELEADAQPLVNVFSSVGGEELGQEFREALERMLPKRFHRRTLTVANALAALEAEEINKLLDHEKIAREAVARAENYGIIFIDEIDKIVGAHPTTGPDVSREGVQRDLLPIVEGTSVTTRWGVVRTDHILFIAAGAFHNASPSDLIPELQGRFPIRVRLDELGKEDFVRILTEPENSLIKQYKALLATEGIELEFEPAAIERIAEVAWRANQIAQNIGARRLHTVLEKLLEDISFSADTMAGKKVVIDWITVESRVERILADEDKVKSDL